MTGERDVVRTFGRGGAGGGGRRRFVATKIKGTAEMKRLEGGLRLAERGGWREEMVVASQTAQESCVGSRDGGVSGRE